jgi:transposase
VSTSPEPSKEALLASLAALKERLPAADHPVIDRVFELIAALDSRLGSLQFLASRPFRTKAEHVDPSQMAMDFIAHLLGPKEAAKLTPAAPDLAAIASQPRPPPRTKRQGNLKAIARATVDRELPEAERHCACCGEVEQPAGHVENEFLRYTPARVTLVTERVWQYACARACGEPRSAPATPKLIDNSLCSSTLLAQLVVGRVLDANPTERFGRQLARHGVELPSSTLYDWFARAGHEAELLIPFVHELLKGSDLVSLDDTPLMAKARDHANGMQRGRLWLYLGDIDQVALCEYSPDWKGSHPQRVLEGFTGTIQNDGYGGLAPLFGPGAPRSRAGCNDHARRRFVDALKQGDRRVETAVALYNALYAVEREPPARASFDERLRLRQEKSRPVWEALGREVEALDRLGERKTPLAKAIGYWQNQNGPLRAFLDDGAVPISNAHVERLLRVVALYRNNSLFIGSPEAGPRYAALLTLALNCVLCGANPYEYFCDLFDRLAGSWPAKRIGELMPRVWLTQREAVQ